MHTNFKKSDGWVKIPVKTRVYALSTVYSAGYVFMDKAYIYLDTEGKDDVAVWLRPKKKGADLDVLAADFCQELLNYAHYFSSLKANAESVKLLLQRALFSAAPSLVQEAEEKEIQDLIKELEAEEKKESKKPVKKGNK
jgi:His-Xaa-Ser system protein HxsD